MASSRSLVNLAAVTGAIVGAGYLVASFGSSKPVGQMIPNQKAELRTQGAQGEARRAGQSEEDALKIKKVETKGGDKGFKVEEKDG